MSRGDVDIELDVKFLHQTGSAYLVTDDEDSDKGVWVPKSKCTISYKKIGHGPEKGDIVKLTIPIWLAEKTGLSG